MAMTISTKGRYALRVMVDLAEHNSDGYLPLKEIAARQEISEKYLELIVRLLVQEGLLEGVRGKGGGYRLTRPPEAYTLGDILRATEGSLAPVACLDEGSQPCSRAGQCRTLPIWQRLGGLLCSFFDSVHLTELLEPGDGHCPGK